jgi:hypothetical protein
LSRVVGHGDGRERRFRAAGAALLAAVVLSTFAGSLDNEFVNWDDGNYIVIDPLVTDPSAHGLRERLTTPGLGYPVPLPVLVYGALWALAPAPWIFHTISLAVHVLNVLLLLGLLRASTGRSRAAWLAAAAFAVHPIVVEPVVWATGLKDLLVGTGALLALTWLRRPPAAFAGALVALASKPSAGLLGPALAGFAWTRPPASVRPRRAVWLGIGAVTLVGVGLLAFTATQETEQLRTSVGHADVPARVLGALGLHVEHVLVPASLSPRYPLSAVTGVHLGLGALVLAGTGALALRWARRRDERLGWLALGLAVYVPASNLRPLIRFTADSYVYVPWMALVSVVALTLVRHQAAIRERAGRSFALLRGSVSLVLAAWALVSFLQVEAWQDTRALWAQAAQRYPDDGESIYRYGDALGRAGEREAELALYLDHLPALEGSPKIPAALITWYAFRGELEPVDGWFALAFASEVRQDDAVYWHYAEHVGRHPSRHAPRHDVALGHALGVHVEDLEASRLDAAQLDTLVAHAERLGRPDVAQRLRTRRAVVQSR